MKKQPQRRTITERIDTDTGRLYGPLPDAIAYLQEVQAKYPGTNISLEEHWTGYEDMDMTFSYTRPETDDEMAARLEKERRRNDEAACEAVRVADRQESRKQYEALKREFGR